MKSKLKPNIWVLGELNADIIMRGKDVLPEFNKEKLVDSFQTVLGSSSAITASVLSGLGAQVTFVSVIGNDDLGKLLMAKLNNLQVNTSHVTVHPEVGTGVTLSLSTPLDRAMLTYMGTIPLLTPKDIPEQLFAEADHLHFGSYFLQEGLRGQWQPIFERARRAGITTSFDTGWDPSDRWDKAEITQLLACTSYFVPSEDEVVQLFGDGNLDRVVTDLPAERGDVIIKCGSKGSLYINPEGQSMRAAPFSVSPIDTTGAGDSFNAGFIYSRVCGRDYEESMRFANACGAMATLRVGGAEEVPTADQVTAFIDARVRS